MKLLRFEISALARTKWYEYSVRFLFGGAITVITGLLAKAYGPVFGGLFLAFPAIFPASATLVEQHEKQKKQSAGMRGSARGRLCAALDARGAMLGGFGLMAFAATFSKLVTTNVMTAFLAAFAAWITLSIALWYARRCGLLRRLKR